MAIAGHGPPATTVNGGTYYADTLGIAVCEWHFIDSFVHLAETTVSVLIREVFSFLCCPYGETPLPCF